MPVILPETIVRRRCAALIPYARNARTHSDQQVAHIAASIREARPLPPVFAECYGGVTIGDRGGIICKRTRLHAPLTPG